MKKEESVQKKDNAIVVSANRGYLFALAEFLINIKDTNDDIIDRIIVYHADFTNKDIEKLLLIDNRITFVKYSYDMFKKEHGEITGKEGLKFIKRYSHMPLSKYKIFEQLKDFKKILYLDLDMLIMDDISELFELKGVAWRNAVSMFMPKFEKYCDINKLHEFTKLSTDSWTTPNGGLIYISDDDIDYKKCLKSGKEYICFFMDFFPAGIDEMVFAWIVYKNKIQLTSLDKYVYNTPSVDYKFSTKIIHFMNRLKIWNNQILQTVFPIWVDNYKKSKEITNFDDEAVVIYDKPCLTEILYEELWKELFFDNKFQISNELFMPQDVPVKKVIFKYSDDIYYEMSCRIFAKDFYIRLFIKSPLLINNDFFIKKITDRMKELGCNIIKNTDKSLIIEDDCWYKIKDVQKNFNNFYNNTFSFIRNYYVNNENLHKNTDNEIIGLKNKEIERLRNRFKKIKDIKSYFDVALNDNDLICLISCKDDCSNNWDVFIENSGIKTSLHPEKRKGLIMALYGGQVIHESTTQEAETLKWRYVVNTLSEQNVVAVNEMLIIKQLHILVISEGYRKGKEKSRILVNNQDYSLNKRGLNIVLINKKYGEVVDSINVDLFANCDFKINRE